MLLQNYIHETPALNDWSMVGTFWNYFVLNSTSRMTFILHFSAYTKIELETSCTPTMSSITRA